MYVDLFTDHRLLLVPLPNTAALRFWTGHATAAL